MCTSSHVRDMMSNRCCSYNNTAYMSRDEDRLLSFFAFIITSHEYLEDVNIDALKHMAFDGFFYDYLHSQIRCYYCDVHLRYEQYITQQIGNAEFSSSSIVHRKGCNRQHTSISPASFERLHEYYLYLKHSIDMRCRLCGLHSMVVIIPCMHMYCCHECMAKLATKNCPACNSGYIEARQVYINQT